MGPKSDDEEDDAVGVILEGEPPADGRWIDGSWMLLEGSVDDAELGELRQAAQEGLKRRDAAAKRKQAARKPKPTAK